MKKQLKQALYTMAPRLPRGDGQTRIVTYHSVGQRQHDVNVTPASFGAQMRWLAENSEVVSLGDAVAGKPGVALTFDAGFADNLSNAAPILREFGFTATVFALPGRLGGFMPNADEEADGRLMTADELCAWRDHGFAVGAHTMTHPRLARLRTDEQQREIAESKQRIEAILDESVPHFAYPYGTAADYTSRTIDCVVQAGFTHAFTNRIGPLQRSDSPFTIRRTNIDALDTLESFIAKVEGRLDGLRWVEPLRRVL